MRLALAILLAVLGIVPQLALAQTPPGFQPAGEFQPTYVDATRAAHEAFTNLDDEKGVLAFSVYEFHDAYAASIAISTLVNWWQGFTGDIWSVDLGLSEVSTRPLGDEVFAVAGSYRPLPDTGRINSDAIVVVRVGEYLWLGTGTRFDQHTPLTDILDTLEHVIGSTPDGETVLNDGHWHGGLFSMLPELSDLPEGFSKLELVESVATPKITPAE